MTPELSQNKQPIVVKIGTALLTNTDGTLNTKYIDRVAEQIAELRAQGRTKIAIVTSGAVAAGVAETSEKTNGDLALKQALASIGQGRLMRSYEQAFKTHGLHAGQVLVDARSLKCEITVKNMRAAVEAMWKIGGIPVFNENDVLATAELEYMSNDILAARLANTLDARELILLTNQDGVCDKNPDDHADAVFISNIVAGHYEHIDTNGKSDSGTGGMSLKFDAADLFKGTTHIANGHNIELKDVLLNEAQKTTIRREDNAMAIYI